MPQSRAGLRGGPGHPGGPRGSECRGPSPRPRVGSTCEPGPGRVRPREQRPVHAGLGRHRVGPPRPGARHPACSAAPRVVSGGVPELPARVAASGSCPARSAPARVEVSGRGGVRRGVPAEVSADGGAGPGPGRRCPGWRCGGGGVGVVVAGLGEEFLGVAGVGEDPDRVGAAVLDRAGVAEGLQRLGDRGQGRLVADDCTGGGLDVHGFGAVVGGAADEHAAFAGLLGGLGARQVGVGVLSRPGRSCSGGTG